MVQYHEAKLIAADRRRVWAAINDPEILQSCITGCKEFSGTQKEGYTAVVTAKIGPVNATFNGVVSLEDIVEDVSCTIVGEGKGGVAGFAKGSAKVNLKDAEGGTELSYDVDARIGGKIAQMGSRLVRGAAKKVADEFFTKLQLQLNENNHSD